MLFQTPFTISLQLLTMTFISRGWLFFDLAFQMKCKYGISNAIYYDPTLIDNDFYFQRMVVCH